jgi:hypothetical protein
MITDLMDVLFGCWHTRYSFPITAKPGHRAKAAQATGTYVVCLDCGKEFAYDWSQMKVVPNDYVANDLPSPARFASKQAA